MASDCRAWPCHEGVTLRSPTVTVAPFATHATSAILAPEPRSVDEAERANRTLVSQDPADPSGPKRDVSVTQTDVPNSSPDGSAGDEPPRTALYERGTCIGRYVILERLGRGGMGVVYRAFDPELGRAVALKLLRTDSAASYRKRLLREAQALARLSHPNVLAVFDVGTFEGNVFIATEFVEGKNMQRWLEAAPRTWREIIGAFLAAGEGLAAAHRAGLVHRD